MVNGWANPKHFVYELNIRVKYTDSPYGLPKFWIWSLAFKKYTDGPYGLQFVTHLVPSHL
ncbi:hypothetical protein HanXRQr2_Chr04g0164921 [Helianthus annuus]|uniref:Uncharacterized protein n=1 Tax=Helianthus annuus TaxID=4232 RepID=A0A9K3J759_HELAN|nr:hypothetical protein HanXRQr2_Chr04g0164921 [Helianthus annuus]KAJ0931199.1 hypothetical protein HanPSC8_Chr04g0158781 [Helianthus annuus]